jgi:ketosteroid isomerase-like protein
MSNSAESTALPDAGVVVRYAHAWEAGDIATLIGCYADDVVAHYGGRSPGHTAARTDFSEC